MQLAISAIQSVILVQYVFGLRQYLDQLKQSTELRKMYLT